MCVFLTTVRPMTGEWTPEDACPFYPYCPGQRSQADPQNKGHFADPGFLGLSLEEEVHTLALRIPRLALLLVHHLQVPIQGDYRFWALHPGVEPGKEGAGGGWREWETIPALNPPPYLERVLYSSRGKAEALPLN